MTTAIALKPATHINANGANGTNGNGTKPSKAKKPTVAAQPLFTPEDYISKIKAISTTILSPTFMATLAPPDYQRGANPKQVKRIQRALQNNEFVPDIIVGVRVVEGKKVYRIVDGLQRATAALGINFSMRATVIAFGTELIERRHFVAFQRNIRVNANLICEIYSDDARNAEVKRIDNIPDHPLKSKVWWGRDKQPDASLEATKLVNAIAKGGLAIEDLEACTRVVATIWPVNRTSLPYKSGGFRGLIGFYQGVMDDDFDHRNEEHVEHMRTFNWETVKADATNNSAVAGTTIGAALLAHWNKPKAKLKK